MMKTVRSRSILALAAAAALAVPPAPAIEDSFHAIEEGSTWRFLQGLAEASLPDTGAWRQPGFDDSSWLTGAAPIGYGDPGIVTDLSLLDPPMPNHYTSVFFRQTFVLESPAGVNQLTARTDYDDGFILWINGTEVLRLNVPGLEGEPLAYNALALGQHDSGLPEEYSLPDPSGYLVAGMNVVAAQIFNVSLNSSDLKFELSLFDPAAPDLKPPALALVVPAAGTTIRRLTQIDVNFTEPVSGVDAADLLVNGTPAWSVTGAAKGPYIFSFGEPPEGLIEVAWSESHGIVDWADPPNPFGGGGWTYTLDPYAPLGKSVINEILAAGGGSYLDEDGGSSDWIEIMNAGDAAVDLGGWYLTDKAGQLTKWRFPAAPLASGGFLVVFASGKNRAESGKELHTNFQLDPDGEFLALVGPDGTTIVHSISPAFPRQYNDISYGLAGGDDSVPLIATRASVAYRVPAGGEGAWQDPAFDDGAWSAGKIALGYGTGEGMPLGGDLVDLAANGTASQSSEYPGGAFPASLAIDGDPATFTQTGAGLNLPATWEIDLGAAYPIATVALHNRQGCCRSRLRDITVSILAPDGTERFKSDLLNPENVLGGGTADGGPDVIALDLVGLIGDLVTGRIVRVVRTPDPDLSGTGGEGDLDEYDVLSLGEVEVIGTIASGYGGLLGTDVGTALRDINSSLYLRIPFTGPDAAPESLILRVRYEDGFVAWLNGVEVARRNAPDTLQWNSAATAQRTAADALVAEAIDISAHTGLLRSGTNLLAVQALNISADDEGLLILPELAGRRSAAGAWRYFRDLTPGAANGEGSPDFVPPECTSCTVPVVEVWLEGPERARHDRLSHMTLHYRNVGPRSIVAPLFRVTEVRSDAPGVLGLRFEGDEKGRGGELLVLGASPDAPAGELPPGGRGQVTILYDPDMESCSWCGADCAAYPSQNCTSCDLEFVVEVFAPPPGEAVDWDSLAEGEPWTSVRSELAVILGYEWDVVQERLADIATRLARRGVPPYDVRELFRFAVRQAYGRPSAAIHGRVTDVDGALQVGQCVFALDQGMVVSSAATDSMGTFVVDWLEAGKTYRLAAAESILEGAMPATIPPEGDLYGVDLRTAKEACEASIACSNCDERGLPDRPAFPPRDLFTPRGDLPVRIIAPWDPNDKVGPTGEGDDELLGIRRPVRPGEEIEYTIHFENLSTAAAAARTIVVEDRIDEDLDLESYRITQVSIGERIDQRWTQEVPSQDRSIGYFTLPGPTLLQAARQFTIVQSRELGGEPIEVPIEVLYERIVQPETRTVRWLFHTVSADPLTGLLLPNDASCQGEGSISYAVRVNGREFLSADAKATNQGRIGFDGAPPIATNEWENPIGVDLPPLVPSYPSPGDGRDRVPLPVILQWADALAASYEVSLWRTGDGGRELVGTWTAEENHYQPESQLLGYGTGYEWQVVARSSEGAESTGPTWRFRTLAVETKIVRGDSNDDGKVDISDAVHALSWLFLGGSDPGCLAVTDTNGDRGADISDPICLLTFLFLGGPPPAAPFPVCGLLPADETLGCEIPPVRCR